MKKLSWINPVTLRQLCKLLDAAGWFMVLLTLCLLALGERFWPLLKPYLQG